MQQDELRSLLTAITADRVALIQRHEAGARVVSNYDFNNAYQYVISREDVHLQWLEAAISDLDGTPEDVKEPSLPPRGKKDSFLPLVVEDAREAEALVARWRPRLAEVTHDRHRKMMEVILGETLEQKRFFDQMQAGNEDLLGRRSNGPGSPGTGDGVLGTRWIG